MTTKVSGIGTDVLVVGAGPVCLLAACELRRHGVGCRLIDQCDAPAPRSRALAIQARTLDLLDGIGVGARFVSAGHALHGANVHSGSERLVHVELDELESRHRFMLMLPQTETERLLTERLASLGGSIERDVKLVALREEADHVVAGTRGPGLREEAIGARWLVGCDGAHSTVRRALALSFEGDTYEERFALADLHIDWDRPADESHAFLSPEGGVLALPMDGAGKHRLIVDLPTDEDVPPTPGVGFYQAILDRRGVLDARLRDPEWMTGFRVHRRLVPRYRQGRSFLAGDAAHVHSPIGGQGMNIGLQDAFNLAWKLALVVRGAARPELLDSYDAERRPIAARTLRGTDLATRVVTLHHPVGPEVRHWLVTFLSSLDVVQRRVASATSQLDLTYRRSPIVSEHRDSVLAASLLHDAELETPSVREWLDFGAAPAAGERAPDVELHAGPDGGGRLLDRLRGTRHTLLLFDGGASTSLGYERLSALARDVASRYGTLVRPIVVVPRAERPAALSWDGEVLQDADGALHHRYGAGAECLYVLRPDGYVGYRSQPAAGDRLLSWLDTVFA